MTEQASQPTTTAVSESKIAGQTETQKDSPEPIQAAPAGAEKAAHLEVKEPPSRKSATASPKWQERLLPVMAGLLIGLTLFFFITTMVQMAYLHWSILHFPPVDINMPAGEALISSAQSFSEVLAARRLEVQARMEAYLVERRYHQASVSLMAGLWLRYLGFVTGMIVALVGASFVLGKLREPVTEIAGKISAGDLSIKSASPGIILVVLGVLLMFATIVNRDNYEIQDSATYLTGDTARAVTQIPTPDSLPLLYPPEMPEEPLELPSSSGP